MKKKFGTPDVSELIDECIYLLLKGELSDPLIKILNEWVELKGNTIKYYKRIKHWEPIIALERMIDSEKSNKMKYLYDAIISYRKKSKEYKEKVNSLKDSESAKELEQWEEKLKTNEEFINELKEIERLMKKNYVSRHKIPIFLSGR